MFIQLGNKVTAKFLDDLKEIGFKYATMGGISVSYSDMIIPEEKVAFIEKSK